MSKRQSLWTELRRRHVARAALGHIIFFWLLVQVADVVLPYIGIIEQPVRWAVAAGVALFPVTLLLAWITERPWRRYTSSRLAVDLAVILCIGLATFAWVKDHLPQVFHARTSIAVLPFVYQENDPQGQILSHALALQVNSLLMNSRSIDVIAHESATAPQLDGLDVREIAEALAVEHVLSGMISSDERTLSVSLSLRNRGGDELWSSEFSDTINNLHAVQERIATGVQERIGLSGTGLSVAEVAAQSCWMPTDPSALDRYFTARHYMEARAYTQEAVQGLRVAVRLFQELVDAHPGFAQAWSGMAWARGYQGTYDPEVSMEGDTRSQQIRQAAAMALELCPTLGEARMMLPSENPHPNGWIRQEENRRLWMDSQPGSTEALQQYSEHLGYVGRQTERVKLAERNYRLNPYSVGTIEVLIRAYVIEKRFEDVEALETKARELGGTWELRSENAKAVFNCEDIPECHLEHLFPGSAEYRDQYRALFLAAESGDEPSIMDAAKGLMDESKGQELNYLMPYTCFFDELTPVFFKLHEWNEPYRVHFYWPNLWIPECDNLWEDPRFKDLLIEAGLVEYYRAKGWPDACRPRGEDITCSGQIWREKRGLPAREMAN